MATLPDFSRFAVWWRAILFGVLSICGIALSGARLVTDPEPQDPAAKMRIAAARQQVPASAQWQSAAENHALWILKIASEAEK